LWPPVSENEAGSSTQHQNLSSSSEIQQPRPYLDQKITVKHSEISTALGEYTKLIRHLEQGDAQAFNQGIERMEQLSKNSAYINTATEAIKQAKDPVEQLFFVKEFKRIAEANLMQK